MSAFMKHEHSGYGFFPGGDPRRFTPDSDATNSPEELAAHKVACEAAEKGALGLDGSCIHGPGFIITNSMFGLGVYTYDCDEPSCDEDGDDPGDPDDGPAQFAAWWARERDDHYKEVARFASNLSDERLRDVACAAFLAGFRARESDPPLARVEGEARS